MIPSLYPELPIRALLGPGPSLPNLSALRPCISRKIARRGRLLRRREGFCHPRHDLGLAISPLEVMQLLYHIIFLLTPDDRNVCTFGYASVAVADIANEQFGAEFSLHARIWDGLSGFCRGGQRGHNGQNAEYHLCTHEFPPSVVLSATIATKP